MPGMTNTIPALVWNRVENQSSTTGHFAARINETSGLLILRDEYKFDLYHNQVDSLTYLGGSFYLEEVQKLAAAWVGDAEHISENATRIEQIELRAEADREARNAAEKNFRIALVYLRRVIRWIDENLPGAHYPPPPTELNLEI